MRAQADLMQIVFRTSTLLYQSREVTERMLSDEEYAAPLTCIRDDLESWVYWTQPRVGGLPAVSIRRFTPQI
jgi:hypothetical protein